MRSAYPLPHHLDRRLAAIGSTGLAEGGRFSSGKAILLLALCLSIARNQADSCNPVMTFADGKTPHRELFVSPSGSNTSGNGSRNSPYQTIARALQGVRPGDAIRLLPGVHLGGSSVINVAGNAEAPIWIGGAPGETRPVIHGGSNGIYLSRVRFLVLENFEVTAATFNGINCDDGGDYANRNATRHVIFRQLSIHDIGTGGNHDSLKLSGINDYFVLDCEFARGSADGSGIDHVGCHQGLIARCTFLEMGSNSIQCKGGSDDIEIRWNRFINGGGRAINIGGSTGFQFFRPPLSTTEPNSEAKNIRVLANVFRGSEAPIAFVGTVNSIVAHNTIVDPSRWIIRILQETVSGGGYQFLPCGDNQFLNNIIQFNRARISTHVNVGGNTDSASFEFSHNLWFASNQASQSRPGLPAPERNGIYGVDPLIRNIAEADFTLSAESPAIGKGRKLPVAPADFLERCYADPPTLGAFEAKPPPPRADADADSLPDAWEDAHGLDKSNPTDAQFDSDSDNLNNLGEYLAGTNPLDSKSFFAIMNVRSDSGALSFQYSTVTGRVYKVQSRSAVGSGTWMLAGMTNGTGTPLEFRQPVTQDSQEQILRVMVEPMSLTP